MILLLGGRGYVGSAFAHYFETNAIAYKSLSRRHVDYSNYDALVEAIRSIKPFFVINAAGYTGKPNVDACEKHKLECLLGNAVLPGVISAACAASSVPWGHVSSGCIYSGERQGGGGFTESDVPNFSFRAGNCSFYSGTKALGEELLMEDMNVYIWRLRIPFDHFDSQRNYLSKLIRYERLLDAENSLSHRQDFVRACLECWNKQVPFGIYNVTNTGAIKTREVVTLIQRYLNAKHKVSFFSSEEEFMQAAGRTPRSSCILSNAKLRNVGIAMSDVKDAIVRALTNWQTSDEL